MPCPPFSIAVSSAPPTGNRIKIKENFIPWPLIRRQGTNYGSNRQLVGVVVVGEKSSLVSSDMRLSTGTVVEAGGSYPPSGTFDPYQTVRAMAASNAMQEK